MVMKKLASQFLLLLFVAATLASCESATEDPNANAVIKRPSLIVLNEGAFQSANASLDVINLESNERTENAIPNLGDVGSDVEMINGKVYVVSSNSLKLYALNPVDGKVVGSINFDAPSSPNAIAKINNDEALVTHLYSPRLDVIDLNSTSVKSSIPVGQGTVDVVTHGNFAYVTAATKVLYIIDLSSKTLVDSIAIGDIPQRVLVDADRNQLITMSWGDWQTSSPGNVSIINIATREVTRKNEVSATSFLQKLVMGQGKVFVIFGDRVEEMNLVSGILTAFSPNPYLGGIYDKETNQLYLGAGNFSSPGRVDILDATLGNVKSSYQAGIAPTHFALYR